MSKTNLYESCVTVSGPPVKWKSRHNIGGVERLYLFENNLTREKAMGGWVNFFQSIHLSYKLRIETCRTCQTGVGDSESTCSKWSGIFKMDMKDTRITTYSQSFEGNEANSLNLGGSCEQLKCLYNDQISHTLKK